jgi:hypothetical protein
MGRTNPTYREFLRSYEESWSRFRRALRRERRDDFDRLFEKAGRFAAAAGQANAVDPARATLLSMLLAQEVELRRLRGRVDDLESGGRDADAPAGGREG